MKKNYQIPEMAMQDNRLPMNLLSPTAPGENIGDGGEGKDEDDPTAKEREDKASWGDLW